MDNHPTSAVVIETLEGSSPDTAILKVTGPLTIHNFFDFLDLSRHQSAPVLLIDLSSVPYIDSAALGSLVAVHISRGHTGKKYAIVGAQERLQALFRMTGIDGFLITYPTLSDAQTALAQTPIARNA